MAEVEKWQSKQDVVAGPETVALQENVEAGSMDKTAAGAKGPPSSSPGQKGRRKPSAANFPTTPKASKAEASVQETATETVRRTASNPRNSRIKSDSELYDRVRLKAALQVLRSGLSPEEKLSALKRGRDHWSQGSQNTGYASWLHHMVDTPAWLHLVSPRSKSMQATSSQCPDGAIPSPSSGTTDDTFEFYGNVFRERFPAGIPTTPASQRLSSGDMDLVLTPPPTSTIQVEHPVVVIEEVDAEDAAAPARDAKSGTNALPTPKEECRPPKSPVTVQEWVDAIDLSHPRVEDECGVPPCPPTDDDTLHLGAEAQHPEGETSEAATNPQQLGNCHVDSEQLRNLQAGHPASLMKALMEQRRLNFVQTHEQQSSFQSDASSLSASSLSSVETLLEARREDPEQILLNLGFGGNSEPLDPLARIPQRFLQPSKVRGNSLEEFIRHQEELLETLDSGFCGYRGLSGFLREHKQPVGIVGKILQKIKDTDREVRHRSSSPSSTLTSFSEVAFSILAVNTFRHALVRSQQQQQQQHSILAPANRELLAQQEEKRASDCESPKRVVVGQDEFKVALDGSLILSGKVENVVVPKRRTMSLVEDDDEIFLDEAPVIEPSNESAGKGLWSKCRQATVRRGEEQALNTEQPCRERRLSQLTRQNSICEEMNVAIENTDEVKTRLSNPEKSVTSKESFELEELPCNAEGESEREATLSHVGTPDNQDVCRIGSALSDSSGFLEGETSDLLADDSSQSKVHPVIEETYSQDLTTILSVPVLVEKAKRPELRKVVSLTKVDNKTVSQSHERFISQLKNVCEFMPIEKPPDPSPCSIVKCCIIQDPSDALRTHQPASGAIASEKRPDKMDSNSVLKLVLNREKLSPVPDLMPTTRLSVSRSAYTRLRGRQCSLDDGSSEGLNLVSLLDPTNNAVEKIDVTESSRDGRSNPFLDSVDQLSVQADNGSDSSVFDGSSCASADMKEVFQSRRSLPSLQDEIDQEYSDMLHLLTVISNGAVSLCISREEFLKKPLDERVQVEAQSLLLALEKYQSTLSSEQLALERYSGIKTHTKSTLRLELQVLCELRAGICQEVAHMRTLLASRLCSAQKGDIEDLRRGTATSIHLIRQMSLLLHQQNTLCKHLESLHLKSTEQTSIGPPFTAFSSLVAKPEMVAANGPDGPGQAPIQQRMQQLFNRLQEHMTTQVQEAVHQEHRALRHELQENRQELQEIKKLLQELVTHRYPACDSSSLPSSPSEKPPRDKL